MIAVTELEMATNTTFTSIINEIQLSNLNFTINVTPFAAYITLKKTLQKDMNGNLATPAPPLLFLLQQIQEQNLQLRLENSKHVTAVKNLEEKFSVVVHENKGLIESLEEARTAVNELTNTNSDLQTRVEKAKKEYSRIQADKSEHENKVKENKKKLVSGLKELQDQVKELKTAKKVKEKENYDLNKTLQNARETIKKHKAEKAQLKTSKTKIEAEVRILKQKQQKEKKDIIIKKVVSETKDENSNFKSLDHVTFSDSPGSVFTTSMVSHFNPNCVKTFQRPASIPSMITHCILSPPPGSSLVSMKEFMEALEKAVDKMFQNMNMKWCTRTSSD